MFIEYDWTAQVYRFRIGDDLFTDFRGARSFEYLSQWMDFLGDHGFRIGRRMASRTYEVIEDRGRAN